MQREANTQSERLAALYRVSSRLGTTLDLKEVLNLVIDSVIQLTRAERGFIVLTDTFGRMQTMAARNMDAVTLDEDKVTVSRTIVQRSIATGEPVLTSNAQDDARFADRASIIGYQFRSIMCAPLRARGRVNGAVFVDNRMLSGVFSEDDLELLVTFANQAAMAIDNARLFQQTDLALARRVEELTVFQRIDRDLHQSLDLDNTLSFFLEWALRLTTANAGGIALLEGNEDDGAELRLYAGQPVALASGGQDSVLLTDPIVQQTVASGEVVQINGLLSNDEGVADQVARLAVPIELEGEVIGILHLRSNTVAEFSADDVGFIKRLADRASVAIGNSRLYNALQMAVDARSKFVSIMTHELRIPLTSIRGYSDLLSKQVVGPLTDQQINFIDIIQRNILRMSALINDLSDINRMESNRLTLELEEVDLKMAINEVKGKFQQDIVDKQQSLFLELPEGRVLVSADYARVIQVLSNLLSNATKYTPEQGTITIRVKRSGNTHAQIEVEDNGFGMKEEDLKRAFQQFFRSEDQAIREHTGWGLGLSIAQMLVERMDGRAELESAYGNGTVATMTLPLANPSSVESKESK